MIASIRTAIAAVVLSFVLVACADDGSNHAVLDQRDGVVVISATKTNAEGVEGAGLGTGFFIGENLIATNNHVISDSREIKLALEKSPDFYEAEVVNTDPVSDFAIIRIKDWEKFKKENHYRVLKFAGDTELVLSQEVYTLGHPWGLAWSMSKGILSGIDRKMGDDPKILLQVDAHVYEGNSGGPLLNNKGEVLGINSLMLARTGGSYGFALPVSMIQKVMRDWVQYEEVRWALLGIKISGAEIKEVTAGGAADKAGLKTGDVITEFTTSEGTYDPLVKNLPSAVVLHDTGEQIVLKVMRDGQPLEITVTPGWRTSAEIPLPPAQ